jgi:hypothetical protein
MRPKTVDFTRNTWGHAMHGDTFRSKRAEKRKDHLLDLLKRRRRYTVMVHTSVYIALGDTVRYETSNGEIVEAKVVNVDWCLDPRDMTTLEIMMVDRGTTAHDQDAG